MRKTIKITGFYLKTADYMVVDKNANKIFFRVRYADNTFTILRSNSNKPLPRRIRSVIDNTAKGMLKRKSGVNFIEKLLQ